MVLTLQRNTRTSGMNTLSDTQCSRCGHAHDEVLQWADPASCWTVTMISCSCGHRWCTVHTHPANLAVLRAWVSQGCRLDLIPPTTYGRPWQSFRLEGLCPVIVAS